MSKLVIVSWIVGLIVSLGAGHLITSILLIRLRIHFEGRKKEWIDFPKKQKERFYLGIDVYPPFKSHKKGKPIHPAIIGIIERLFFTIVVALNLAGAVVAMIGWIGLKTLASRPHREMRAEKLENETGSTYSPAPGFQYAGVFGNLTSMFFALTGGLIIRFLLKSS